MAAERLTLDTPLFRVGLPYIGTPDDSRAR